MNVFCAFAWLCCCAWSPSTHVVKVVVVVETSYDESVVHGDTTTHHVSGEKTSSFIRDARVERVEREQFGGERTMMRRRLVAFSRCSIFCFVVL